MNVSWNAGTIVIARPATPVERQVVYVLCCINCILPTIFAHEYNEFVHSVRADITPYFSGFLWKK